MSCTLRVTTSAAPLVEKVEPDVGEARAFSCDRARLSFYGRLHDRLLYVDDIVII